MFLHSQKHTFENKVECIIIDGLEKIMRLLLWVSFPPELIIDCSGSSGDRIAYFKNKKIETLRVINEEKK